MKKTLVVIVLAAASSVAIPAAEAERYITCRHNSETARVDIDLSQGTVGIRRNEDAIYFKRRYDGEYKSCDGATVHNTDRIVFTTNNTETDVLFQVDLSHGSFTPGKTEENSGASEIEIVANYSGGGDAMFGLIGTPLSDEFYMGSKGTKINGDDDIDIDVNKAGFQAVHTLSGDDFATMSGGSGTGGPVPAGSHNWNRLEGGLGNDVLIGGPGLNEMLGQADRDRLIAKGGRDFVNGGLGADRIFGKKGSDIGLYGDEGDDHIEGGDGDDLLSGQLGNDHLDGDDGKDECDGGLGMNTHEDCETYKESPI